MITSNGQQRSRQASTTRILRWLPTLLSILLLGCSTPTHRLPTSAAHPPPIDTIAKGRHTAATTTQKPLSMQTLYDLLLGEMAAQNQQFPLASEKYLAAARRSGDEGMAAHAAKLALYDNNHRGALAAATQWYAVAPESVRAATLYANLLARTGNHLGALDILERQLERRQEADFSQLWRVPPGTKTEQKLLLQRLEILGKKYQDHNDTSANANAALSLSYAHLLQRDGQIQQALDVLQSAKKIPHRRTTESAAIIPPNIIIEIALLKSHLLQKLKRPKEARSTIKKSLKTYPDNRKLQLRLARLLTQTDLQTAEKLFAQLLEETPQDADLLLSHALITKQNKRFSQAKKQFNTLLLLGKHRGISHYSLGEIANQEKDDDLAIDHFSRVPPGQYFLPAAQRLVDIFLSHQQLDTAQLYLEELRRIEPLQAPKFWVMEAEMLQRDGQQETAHNILDNAVMQFPEQLLLRLKRALSHERRQEIRQAEHDLRFIIARAPDNASALNALGYMLSNHSQRYDEALDLIRRAHRLQPDNPAIIDSLGWIYYRRGNLQQATTQLERAFEKWPDDEIAAHLIEAYWVDGKKLRARQLLRKLKHRHTELPAVRSVASQLGIPF